MRHVKIPEKLFFDLVFFHLLEHDGSEEEIKKGLTEKMDAMMRHEDFSRYKTGLDGAVREEARRRYLDGAGISRDFRR